MTAPKQFDDDGSQQKIFTDCEGQEFEHTEVSFWIYKHELAAQFVKPVAVDEHGREVKR